MENDNRDWLKDNYHLDGSMCNQPDCLQCTILEEKKAFNPVELIGLRRVSLKEWKYVRYELVPIRMTKDGFKDA